MGGIWDIYELLPAFLAALAVIYAVSRFTDGPDKKTIKEFEEYKSLC